MFPHADQNMENVYHGTTFPMPPSIRPVSSRGYPLYDKIKPPQPSVTSLPPSLQKFLDERTFSLQDPATQQDIRVVLEYLLSFRHDLDAEKRQRGEDVGDVRNQMQRMYEDWTASSRRESDRISSLKVIVKEHTNQFQHLEGRVDSLDQSAISAKEQMAMIADELQSARLRKLLNVMPRGTEGKRFYVVTSIRS